MIWSIPEQFNVGFPVDVFSDPDLLPFCCEYNCDSYISRFGGEKIEGAYVLQHNFIDLYQLVRHFVVFDGKNYIDVTPFDDCRLFNWFVPVPINNYNLYVRTPVFINTTIKQETNFMYYVYCYVDPTSDQPFYVGKGKQDRAYSHLHSKKDASKPRNKTRFANKLRKMKEEGIEPKIIFLAQNIEDEKVAYEIEEAFIKQYGRKGYTEGGVLLNICESNKPPSHKGKSYDEIYGDRAEEQRKKRHDLQLEVGGWFKGRKHTEKAKTLFREAAEKRKEKSPFNEGYLLKIGGDFCKHFNNEISKKKWIWWCTKNQVPIFTTSYRFNGRYILDVFDEEFGAVKKFDSLLWFHNPITKKTWRCLDWELNYGIVVIPEGYIRGRGKGSFTKTKKTQEVSLSAYVVGGVKKDLSTDSLKGMSL